MGISKLTDDKSKLTTLIVFGVDILILIIVLIILWTMPEPKTPGDNCGYMCLPCSTSSTGICCSCRATVMENYAEKKFDEEYERTHTAYSDIFKERVSNTAKIYGGYIGDVKPVAHLIGEEREPTDKAEPLPVTKWHKGNNCLLLNGMSMHHGRFRVPANGYYHVYSMLDISYHFGKDGSRLTIPSTMPYLKHSIYRSNIYKNSDEEVISTYHPYEFSKNEVFGRFDTYISSDIYLNAGDEVYVKVSNISQVNSPPKNTLGISMI